MLDKALEDLDVLNEFEKENFEELDYDKIKAVGKKAILIDGEWIAKSQLRCDFEKNIYISNWLAGKLD